MLKRRKNGFFRTATAARMHQLQTDLNQNLSCECENPRQTGRARHSPNKQTVARCSITQTCKGNAVATVLAAVKALQAYGAKDDKWDTAMRDSTEKYSRIRDSGVRTQREKKNWPSGGYAALSKLAKE